MLNQIKQFQKDKIYGHYYYDKREKFTFKDGG
jgi:hypothetical protein